VTRRSPGSFLYLLNSRTAPEINHVCFFLDSGLHTRPAVINTQKMTDCSDLGGLRGPRGTHRRMAEVYDEGVPGSSSAKIREADIAMDHAGLVDCPQGR